MTTYRTVPVPDWCRADTPCGYWTPRTTIAHCDDCDFLIHPEGDSPADKAYFCLDCAKARGGLARRDGDFWAYPGLCPYCGKNKKISHASDWLWNTEGDSLDELAKVAVDQLKEKE